MFDTINRNTLNHSAIHNVRSNMYICKIPWQSPESDLVSKPPDKMFISNVFRTHDNIEAGDQLLFTMKTALPTDVETEFQYSTSLVFYSMDLSYHQISQESN